MRKTLALILIVLGSLTMVTAAAADQPAQDHKITICHRTNSDTNPYVQITVDTDAADGVASKKGPADHFGEHQGPIWNDTLKPQHIEWGDIIPPIEGVHTGLNWTVEGQAVYGRGCTFGHEPTTTTSTTGPTTTTTVKINPHIIPTTTTVPTTLAPTTTVKERPVPPKVVATDQPAPAPAVAAESLPNTGSNTTWLMVLGISLILAGALLTAGSRRAMVR